MPCRDWDDSGVSTVYQDTPETKALVDHLKARNDLLMKSLCAVDKWARSLKMVEGEYCAWLGTQATLLELILDHRKADEQRWFHTYYNQFPDFTKAEIAKMVRAGILEDK